MNTALVSVSTSTGRAFEMTYVNQKNPRNKKGHLRKMHRTFRAADLNGAKFLFNEWKLGEFVQYGIEYKLLSTAEVLPHATPGSLAKLNSPRPVKKPKYQQPAWLVQRNQTLREMAAESRTTAA